MPWNTLEVTSTRPEATKFQLTMRRYSEPNATTAASRLKKRTSAAGARWHSRVNTSITAAAMPAAARNDSRTRSPSRAPKFWPATGRRREGDRHRRQEHRLHQAHADAEARLGRRRRSGA